MPKQNQHDQQPQQRILPGKLISVLSHFRKRKQAVETLIKIHLIRRIIWLDWVTCQTSEQSHPLGEQWVPCLFVKQWFLLCFEVECKIKKCNNVEKNRNIYHKYSALSFLVSTKIITFLSNATWQNHLQTLNSNQMATFVYVILSIAVCWFRKVQIDGFGVDCLSTSLSNERCQCKNTWMQQNVLHFLLLSPSSHVRGRKNDAVNTDPVHTVILGPFYLPWQLVLLLKSNAQARGKG